MQQTIERAEARSRPRFLRRLLVRGNGKKNEPQPAPEPAADPIPPTTVIDLRGDLPAAEWRVAVSDRLERLETGMSLVAETMKRAFAQVFRSIEDLRGNDSSPDGERERIVDDSLSSLKSSVEDLAESIRQVPYVLAAAADDIRARLEMASPKEDDPFQPNPVFDPSSPPEVLPATPFELEPVEDQFAPMDDGPTRIEARRIWGSGA